MRFGKIVRSHQRVNGAPLVGRRGAGSPCFGTLTCFNPTLWLNVLQRFPAPLVPPYEHVTPRERRPTNAVWKDRPVASAREWSTVGGPARCGIYLFRDSNLLQADSLAQRFAEIPRPACPTLRVPTIFRRGPGIGAAPPQTGSDSPASTIPRPLFLSQLSAAIYWC